MNPRAAKEFLYTGDRVSAQRLLASAPKAGSDRLQMVLGAQLVEFAAHLPSVLKALTQAPVPWK